MLRTVSLSTASLLPFLFGLSWLNTGDPFRVNLLQHFAELLSHTKLPGLCTVLLPLRCKQPFTLSVCLYPVVFSRFTDAPDACTEVISGWSRSNAPTRPVVYIGTDSIRRSVVYSNDSFVIFLISRRERLLYTDYCGPQQTSLHAP